MIQEYELFHVSIGETILDIKNDSHISWTILDGLEINIPTKDLTINMTFS